MKSAEFERDLASDAVRVVEAAAIAADALVGAATRRRPTRPRSTPCARRSTSLDIDGVIVIGEGERDEAPMLYIGEKVGTRQRPARSISRSIRWKAPP